MYSKLNNTTPEKGIRARAKSEAAKHYPTPDREQVMFLMVMLFALLNLVVNQIPPVLKICAATSGTFALVGLVIDLRNKKMIREREESRARAATIHNQINAKLTQMGRLSENELMSYGDESREEVERLNREIRSNARPLSELTPIERNLRFAYVWLRGELSREFFGQPYHKLTPEQQERAEKHAQDVDTDQLKQMYFDLLNG